MAARNGHAPAPTLDLLVLDEPELEEAVDRRTDVDARGDVVDDPSVVDAPIEAPPIGGRDADALDLPARLQALLFVAAEPVPLATLARTLDLPRREIERALDALADDLAATGLRLQRGDGAAQLVTAPEAADDVRHFLGRESATPLSRAALETLAIIAYRQPLTRPEVDELRGVNSDGVVRTLLARGLIEPLGRRETVGHPIEYGTTFAFLEYFGLRGLDDLPPIDVFPSPASSPAEADEGADFLAGSVRPTVEAARAPDDATATAARADGASETRVRADEPTL